MTKGLERSLSRGPALSKGVVKDVFVLDALALTIDGASGVGFGSVVLGDFPEGNILFLGATGYISVAGPGGNADLSDTWTGDYSVGTTPADDGTVTTGDIDIINKTTLAVATSEVSPRTRGVSVNGDTGEIHDNTDGSLELNLNVLVDNADIGADDIAFTATGEITVAYMMLGDD